MISFISIDLREDNVLLFWIIRSYGSIFFLVFICVWWVSLELFM